MPTDENEQLLTIKEFCRRQRIAASTYFAEAKQGRGPRIIRIGSSVRISRQAEADYRREREIEAFNHKKAS